MEGGADEVVRVCVGVGSGLLWCVMSTEYLLGTRVVWNELAGRRRILESSLFASTRPRANRFLASPKARTSAESVPAGVIEEV